VIDTNLVEGRTTCFVESPIRDQAGRRSKDPGMAKFSVPGVPPILSLVVQLAAAPLEESRSTFESDTPEPSGATGQSPFHSVADLVHHPPAVVLNLERIATIREPARKRTQYIR